MIKSQSVESLEALWQRAEVVLSGDGLREAVEADAAELARKVRMPGFRPGRVSTRAVRQRFGSRLYEEVAERLRGESFQRLANEMRWRLAHPPELSWLHDASAWPPLGEDLSYRARFETLPEVGKIDYASLAVARPTAELSEADVAGHIEKLRRGRADWSAVDRPSRPGDRVLVVQTATRNGERVDAYSIDDPEPVELGEPESGAPPFGAHPAARAELLRGLGPDGTAGYSLRVPDAEPLEESLRGAEIAVTMRVHSVQEARLPELDDALFASFGVRDGGYDAFVDEVRAQMRRHLDKALRAKLKHRVFAALNRLRADLPVPETQAEREARLLGIQRPAEDPAARRERARRNVRVGLLLDGIVRAEALSAPPSKVDAHIDDLAEDYSDSEEFKRRCRRDPDAMARIEETVLQEHVVDWLLERAAVDADPIDYDAAMRPEPEPEPELDAGPRPAPRPATGPAEGDAAPRPRKWRGVLGRLRGQRGAARS